MKRAFSLLVALALVICLLPLSAIAEEWNIANGSITVNANANNEGGTTQKVKQGSNEKEDNAPVITGTSEAGRNTANTVTINSNEGATANVTLKDLTIDADSSRAGRDKAAVTVNGAGNTNIELDGTNKLTSGDNHGGLEKNDSGTLTISDNNNDGGSLDAKGGTNGAGIGGGVNVTTSGNIFSGNLSVTVKNDGDNIVIEGGTINAQGGAGAAGIGGGGTYLVGGSGDASGIEIKDGNVTAKGGAGAAGIGGGTAGDAEGVNISGGKVNAEGGVGGAGIGSGTGGNAKDIGISGGEVDAQGGAGGAGIGGGSLGGDGEGIAISGGTVNAQGGASAAGIGGGNGGDGEGIAISGGTVNAQGGTSTSASVGSLVIDGGNGGAGIGGGNGGDGKGVDISGGEVTTVGGSGGAGIGGGGTTGDGEDVTISGGKVTAVGGNSAAGIGGGIGGEGEGVTVTGDAIVAVAGGDNNPTGVSGLINAGAGTGAAIGNGGSGIGQAGAEDPNLNTSHLTTGSVSFYEPGTSAEDILSGDAEAVMYDIIYGSGEITKDEFLIFCQQTAKRIQTTESNSTLEIDGRRFPGFMKMVFDALAARPDVALNVRCIIDGKVAEVKIPGGFDFTNALGSKSVLTFSEIAKLVG